MNHLETNQPPAADIGDAFDSLFREAEQSEHFWVSQAKLRFTNEMLQKMAFENVNKSELANRLQVSQAQISRLCSGKNNFTIETMVKVARALGYEFIPHFKPKGAVLKSLITAPDTPLPPAP